MYSKVIQPLQESCPQGIVKLNETIFVILLLCTLIYMFVAGGFDYKVIQPLQESCPQI